MSIGPIEAIGGLPGFTPLAPPTAPAAVTGAGREFGSMVLDGIERLTSNCSEGMGFVTVEVTAGKDVRKVLNDVKSRVDAIQNFAESVEKPIISDVLIKNQVMSVAITAQLSPPSSEPANRAFLRLRASGLIDRSTVLESRSMRPSSMKRERPSQRVSA